MGEHPPLRSFFFLKNMPNSHTLQLGGTRGEIKLVLSPPALFMATLSRIFNFYVIVCQKGSFDIWPLWKYYIPNLIFHKGHFKPSSSFLGAVYQKLVFIIHAFVISGLSPIMIKYKLADRSPKISRNHPKFFRASFYAIPPKEKKVQLHTAKN